jgi:hypothetical protein
MCVLTQLLSTVVGYAHLTGSDRRPPGVDLSTAGAQARRPGIDPASTQRRPVSTTPQVDAVDAYHPWLASTCVDLRQPCVKCVEPPTSKRRQLRRQTASNPRQRRQIGALDLGLDLDMSYYIDRLHRRWRGARDGRHKSTEVNGCWLCFEFEPPGHWVPGTGWAQT